MQSTLPYILNTWKVLLLTRRGADAAIMVPTLPTADVIPAPKFLEYQKCTYGLQFSKLCATFFFQYWMPYIVIYLKVVGKSSRE